MLINILEYLEKSAKRYPDKIAFSDQENQITFNELMYQAKAIGCQLAEIMENQQKKPIAVLVDRNILSIISLMGVVYSGNFYVPIDGKMPRNRIEVIIKTIQPNVVISLKNKSKLLNDIKFYGQVLLYEEAITQQIDDANLKSIRNNAIDTDPLYAVFTSGSTGVPKGVLINHRSVIDLIEHFTDIFEFSDESIFGNQAPIDYDGLVIDMYSTLKNGATMHIIPKMMFSFPLLLIEHLNKMKINTIKWSTSALRIIANLKTLEEVTPSNLEKILFTGEVMPNKVLNYWRKYIPNALYVNLYGPTEITCLCTYFIVNRSFADHDVLPIGIPFPNTDILVLNEENQIAGENEIGEICVRGTSLALGYYNDLEETSRSFCQNPLNLSYPELVYRTGDLGKYNELGELLFLSRKDNQIKHMGHRIELGEIEAAGNALDFLDTACCLYDDMNEKIVLFYQSSKVCNKEILLGLRDFLPKYMMPNKMIHYEKLPVKNNMKIDRNKLSKTLSSNNK